ncbi:hypothetical protein QFZ27_001888 [Inquilinus ginsengisoli]|uniref:BREX-3 system P-loop-containing protein BrxF n=1 Tax=Inquilinus ginsengisoli TaxID=363840 RepID=UPI003D1FF352
MLERLNFLVDEVGDLNSKLVLVVGQPRSGKTRLLNALAKGRHMGVVNVGAVLGRLLLEVPGPRRHAGASRLFKEVADVHAAEGIVLLDNIELLFDRSLLLNPLDLLKRQAHVRRVVAVWPGGFSDNRLTYATMGHPEYQDYGIDGLVPFKTN